ncbi:hypothetical protein STAIW_v1c04750 [Spiroplasma taiwanense CT-1]|uniref:Uncharacterized protein n=1 Tax=Spiroplasma taiwanense CT-1 TaxID=1276220 RepID=S5LZI0_9MOLU|nr:hypothetical protein STAIW_v1c04750 [Spiroplasma taiwanense CT-1]
MVKIKKKITKILKKYKIIEHETKKQHFKRKAWITNI